MKGSGSQSFNKATDTMKELGKEIGSVAPGSSTSSDIKKTGVPLGGSSARPMAVEVVPSANPIQSLQNLLGPLLTGGMIIIFTIFILAGREDLRDRLIRLAGKSRLHLMTQAMDDAARRINKYLFLQLVVNSAFGAIIGFSLQFIGIPNAALWGVLAAILRFLPYIGPPLASLMPILLSLAVFPGWHHAALTAALFLILEIIVSNIVEPLLYSSHIGLSPIAILLSAVFWTLIWGFPGLVLSTPLTVCLVVMGRHVPSLGFLNILLGDEPMLSPSAQFYQRLLASDQSEAKKVIDSYLKDKSLQELYSGVVIPALELAENDRHRNVLDEKTQAFIHRSTKEIIEQLEEPFPVEQADLELADNSNASEKVHAENSPLEILCMPARDNADELIALLLSQLLNRQGHKTRSISICSTEQMLSQVAELQPQLVCISALPPLAIGHASALYAKLKAQFPELHIVICLWHFEGDFQKVAARMEMAAGHGLFTTLPEILQHCEFLTKPVSTGMQPH